MSFWEGKKVFLTGHTGFKGGWLATWLKHIGAEVTGYSLSPPTSQNLFDLAHVGEGMSSIIGDIRDYEGLKLQLDKCQPEIIFHLAAQPLVRKSYEDPVSTYSTNVMGTVHLLEAARSVKGVRVIVNITSDKCYENKEWYWGYRENEPMGGYDPYSSSKGCAELVSSAYRRSFYEEDGRVGVALATARAGNVIGGGDWAKDRLVPDAVRAFSNREPLVIRNPGSVRPWQHVIEPLKGYLVLAEQLWETPLVVSGAWNFGPVEEDAKNVAWIAAQLSNLWGEGADYEIEPDAHMHEARYLKLDCSKANLELGWRPKWSIGESLKHTIEWYRMNIEGGDVRSLMLNQIDKYESN